MPQFPGLVNMTMTKLVFSSPILKKHQTKITITSLSEFSLWCLLLNAHVRIPMDLWSLHDLKCQSKLAAVFLATNFSLQAIYNFVSQTCFQIDHFLVYTQHSPLRNWHLYDLLTACREMSCPSSTFSLHECEEHSFSSEGS